MKSGAGNVTMQSAHVEQKYTQHVRSSSVQTGGFLNLSIGTQTQGTDSGKYSQLATNLGRMQSFEQRMKELKTQCEDEISSLDVKNPDEMKADLLMWLIDMLCGKKPELKSAGYTKGERGSAQELYTLALGTDSSSGTYWQRTDTEDTFDIEAESTTFAARGTAKTTDGREISFNVELGLSREFIRQTNVLSDQEMRQGFMTAPLVINYDAPSAELSDQKFFFDIDSDGEEDTISKTAYGSGFLALDKNGDGRINDGSELFGTKSGDGFKDLAEYDDDGNGWIDENDDVFSKLKIWTNDENGNNRLISLADADVGAIYLGSASTQYSLKDPMNMMHGAIRKTGIFLHESDGTAGTVSHVDLVRG